MVTKRKATKKRVNKWYAPGVKTGWSKDLSEIGRRRKALVAHKGNYLATGRGLQSLSNVTTDPKTKRLAASDARYFFKKHKETGK